MRILIAGGAGFIGSHSSDALLKNGNTVMVVDNYSSGNQRNNKPHENLITVKGNISDRMFVIETVKSFNPEIIIHCAVEPVVNPPNIAGDITTNITGTANLLEAGKLVGIKRFIYFQTVLIYGDIATDDPLSVDTPVNPLCSYAITKLCAENFIRSSNIDFVSFRLANHYGGRNMTGVFPIFYKKLSSGEPCIIADERRTFVYICDLVRLIVKACDLSYPKGIYHVSSPDDYSIYDIFKIMHRKIKGFEFDPENSIHKLIPSAKGSMKIMKLDYSNTSDIFQWHPEVNLETGIDNALAWYAENGVGKTYTHLKTE